jgi:hypothetical protein
MLPVDFDPIADFFAEDPIERLGVLGFSLSGWLVAVTNGAPTSFAQSVIQIVPPILGIWVAHRSMERAHELRMEKISQARAAAARPLPPLTPNPEAAKPDDPTVDLP